MNVRLRETIPLDEFWIARHELTIAEYLPYLHSEAARLAIQEGEQRGTHLRVPRAPVTPQDWQPKCSLLPGWALRGGRYEFAGDTSLPIAGLACEDVDAYCAWLTLSSPAGRAGWYFRLPTKDEWERAARGADARRFVWGDVGNARFCRGREAREPLDSHGAVLEPGLRFPVDESPFGVRDMTGNLFELCAGSYATVGLRPWCGGHRQLGWPECEEKFLAAYVEAGNPTRPGHDDGFRIVAWRSEPNK
jgi:formylglycine-generating enzyme required for sulfatase activity